MSKKTLGKKRKYLATLLCLWFIDNINKNCIMHHEFSRKFHSLTTTYKQSPFINCQVKSLESSKPIFIVFETKLKLTGLTLYNLESCVEISN